MMKFSEASQKRSVSLIRQVAMCCLFTGIGITQLYAPELAGITLPDAANAAGTVLQLNGMGLLKKMIFFKVYVVALYLEHPTRDAQQAIGTDEGKRMVINMRHDVDRATFVQVLEDVFTRNSGSKMPQLRERLNLLEHALPSLKKGDVLDFTYLPGSGSMMRCHGRELIIPGKDFAEALFSIWLGREPVSDRLKHELLGQVGK